MEVWLDVSNGVEIVLGGANEKLLPTRVYPSNVEVAVHMYASRQNSQRDLRGTWSQDKEFASHLSS